MNVPRIIVIDGSMGAAQLIALLEATNHEVVQGPATVDLRQKCSEEISQHLLHMALQRIVPADVAPMPAYIRHTGKQKAQWKRERSGRR